MADRPYGKFYDFYSVSLETFGSTHTSAKVARGVIRDWTSRKHEEHWQSTCGLLTLSLMTGYKMYAGLVFYSTVLGGIRQQSYQFFYLFIEVPLTNSYHYAVSRVFF